MGKTRTEMKLEKAMKALKAIGYNSDDLPYERGAYARKVYTDLTTPRTEPIETRAWRCKSCRRLFEHRSDVCEVCSGAVFIELTGIDSRPVKEESLTKKVGAGYSGNKGMLLLPAEWINRRVKVELLEEGE